MPWYLQNLRMGGTSLLKWSSLSLISFIIQGDSNMTGTDLCVNKSHCVAAVRPWESEATTSTLPPARLEPVQSCLGVARVMSGKKVPRSVEQRIVITFLVGENVPSAEIHHRLQQQYGEECLLRRHVNRAWGNMKEDIKTSAKEN